VRYLPKPDCQWLWRGGSSNQAEVRQLLKGKFRKLCLWTLRGQKWFLFWPRMLSGFAFVLFFRAGDAVFLAKANSPGPALLLKLPILPTSALLYTQALQRPGPLGMIKRAKALSEI